MMKRILTTIGVLMAGYLSFGQSIIHVSAGEEIWIATGERVSLGGLVLVPSGNYSITPTTLVTNTEITRPAINPMDAIERVYSFSSYIPAYAGMIRMYYDDSELGSADENTLTVNAHNNTIWTNTATASANTTDNYVEAQQSNYEALVEVTLTPLYAILPDGRRILSRRSRTSATTENLTVYPNPVIDRFQIKGAGPGSILLIDNCGNLIRHWNSVNSYYSLNGIPSGNYWLVNVLPDGTKRSAVLFRK